MPDDLVGPVVVEASFAQQSLWLQHQIDPGRPTYHVPNIVRVRGQLNRAVLERTLNVLVGRHEVLRTVFDMEDGSLVQVIGPAPKITVPVQAAGASEVPGLVRAELDRPFDLRTGAAILSQNPAVRDALDALIAARQAADDCMAELVKIGRKSGVRKADIERLADRKQRVASATQKVVSRNKDILDQLR